MILGRWGLLIKKKLGRVKSFNDVLQLEEFMQSKNILYFFSLGLSIIFFHSSCFLQAQNSERVNSSFMFIYSYKDNFELNSLSTIPLSVKKMQLESIFHRTFSPQNIYGNFYVIDTVTQYSSAGVWRYSYTYDAIGNKITKLDETNGLRYNFTYNANGKLISELDEQNIMNQWWNTYRYTLTYDQTDHLIYLLGESFLNDNWLNDYRISFNYDLNGNISSQLREQWSNAQWKNVWRNSYIYDANNKLLYQTNENWANDQWVNLSRGTYTYDANGKIFTITSEDWMNGQWTASYRYTFSYDLKGKEISELGEKSLNGVWENTYRYSYTYNAFEKLITQLREIPITNGWVNYDRFDIGYDAHENAETIISAAWDNNGWKIADGNSWIIDSQGKTWFFNGYHISLHYKQILTEVRKETIEIPTSFQLSQNYPNPFNPSTTINFDLPESGPVTLALYNLLGERVDVLINRTMGAGSHFIQYDASKLNSGVYIYQIKMNNFLQAKKMIFLK